LKKYSSIYKHYEECFDRHGDTHLGVDWPRTGASSPRPLYLTECLLIGPKENAA